MKSFFDIDEEVSKYENIHVPVSASEIIKEKIKKEENTELEEDEPVQEEKITEKEGEMTNECNTDLPVSE